MLVPTYDVGRLENQWRHAKALSRTYWRTNFRLPQFCNTTREFYWAGADQRRRAVFCTTKRHSHIERKSRRHALTRCGLGFIGASVPAPESIARARKQSEATVQPTTAGCRAVRRGWSFDYFSRGTRRLLLSFLNEGDVLFARYGKDDERMLSSSYGLQDLNDQFFRKSGPSRSKTLAFSPET